jgi:hypothetical protein
MVVNAINELAGDLVMTRNKVSQTMNKKRAFWTNELELKAWVAWARPQQNPDDGNLTQI